MLHKSEDNPPTQKPKAVTQSKVTADFYAKNQYNSIEESEAFNLDYALWIMHYAF